MVNSLAYGGPAADDWLPAAGNRAVNTHGADAAHARPPEVSESACRAWVGAMAKGDEAALSAFYDATLGRVYGLALRITRRPECAAEVASDVYLQAWREAGRYDAERGKVLAWLMTICRTRALDLLRRADEAEAHPDPESLVPEARDQPGTQDLLDSMQEHADVHRALAKLEPLQRQLVALAFFRGLSHQEIAAHARLPLGSVKTYIRKALSTMREHLPDRRTSRGQA